MVLKMEHKLATNNTAPTRQFVDNRVRIEVDPERVEAWELMAVESSKLTDIMLVLCRYLANGHGLVGCDWPTDDENRDIPLNSLSRAELSQIQHSKAFGLIQRFKPNDIKNAAQEFAQGALADIDPN